MASTVATQKEGPRFKSRSDKRPFFVHVVTVCTVTSSKDSSFLPQSKTWMFTLIEDFKLNLGVSEKEWWEYVCVIDWV